MYAITHLQTAIGTWYWQVCFKRGGREYRQSFPEIRHGGRVKARRAATAWRDEQLTKISALSLIEFCQQQRSNNTSGVPGVHYLTPERQPLGIWQARLMIDGRAKYRTFSVSKYGYEEARQKAVAARRAMLAAADDRPYLYAPTAKRLAPNR